MSSILSGSLAVAIVIGLVFLWCIGGTLMGAAVAWVISITPWLGATVEGGFGLFGFNVVGNLVAVGAVLGFISGMLKGIVTVNNEKGKNN